MESLLFFTQTAPILRHYHHSFHHRSLLPLSLIMVSIKSIAAILAFSVFSASALPSSEAGSPIDTRITRIDIRYCKHINWGKPCQDARIALNECCKFAPPPGS